MKRLLLICLIVPVTALLISMIPPPEDEEKAIIWFNVHEDLVHPSKVFDYEATCKKLKALCEEHEIPDLHWMTAGFNDFRYIHVNKLDKFADLDRNAFAALEEKIGEEKLNELWDEFDQCYSSHRNYTIGLNVDLSYMPNGMEISMDKEPFRVFRVVHFDQVNSKSAMATVGKFKELHESVKSPLHYRIYNSGYGEMGPYVMVVFSAENEVDFYTRLDKAKELMGDKRMPLMKELLSVTTKFEEVQGEMKADLSYGSLDMTAASKE